MPCGEGRELPMVPTPDSGKGSGSNASGESGEGEDGVAPFEFELVARIQGAEVEGEAGQGVVCEEVREEA